MQSPQEVSRLVGAAIHMLSRLRDHIERLDDGAVTAVDDLAVVLRLLVLDGRGNQLLWRVRNSFQLDMPEVTASLPPRETVGVQLSVGRVPALPGQPVLDAAASSLSLSKLLTGPAFIVEPDSKGTSRLSWARFIGDYAEKWGGAHYQSPTPDHLPIIDSQEVAGLSLSGYMLRTMAVTVWHAGQGLVQQALRAGGVVRGGDDRDITLVAPGGVSGAPRDRTSAGRLQHLTITRELADFLWYVDAAQPGPIRLGRLTLGGLPRVLTHTPGAEAGSQEHAVPHLGEPATSARHYPLPASVSFTEGREVKLSGRVIDPERRAAGGQLTLTVA